MVEEIILEFPEFITHVAMNNPSNPLKKAFKKIGFNSIYSVPHWILRSKMIDQIHAYLHQNIPNNLEIETPIETILQIYVPINYGDVSIRLNKKIGRRVLVWIAAKIGYIPKWDLFNLSVMWIKCFEDCIVAKKIIKDDSVFYIRKGSYEFISVDHIDLRKLVYTIKTIK